MEVGRSAIKGEEDIGCQLAHGKGKCRGNIIKIMKIKIQHLIIQLQERYKRKAPSQFNEIQIHHSKD